MKCVKLNQLCEINIGKTPSRSNSEYWGKGHKWLSIADMKSKYISETKEEITDLAVSEANMKIVPKNTVLMSFKLSIGKIGITTEEMYTNEAIASFPIIEKEKIISEYLYYVLKTLRYDNLSDRAVMGATLNKKKLNQIVIPLPSIIVQKKIVNLLNKAEELIDKRKAQIEALDQLTQSVFLEMFGDPITNPQNWPIKKLGDNIEITGGFAFKSTEFVESGVPVIKIGTVNKGYFDLTTLTFVSKVIDKYEKYLVYPSDLLITLTGTVGKEDYGNVCIVPNDYEFYLLNQRVAKIKPLKNLNVKYLLYCFKQEKFKRRITKLSRGIRQANISNDDIKNLVIPIPPLEVQRKFETIEEKMQHQKNLINKSLLELEKNYNSLLQRAFKGELFNEEKVSNL